MLVRAARRNARVTATRSFYAAYEQLYLPWLCPSYTPLREARKRYLGTGTGAQQTPLRKRRNSQDGSRDPATRRSLATHVDQSSSNFGDISYSTFDSIPFVHSTGTDGSNTLGNRSDSGRAPWDPAAPLMVHDTLATPPRRHRSTQGIGGETHEIMSVLEACLQVERIERAGVILRRVIALDVLREDEVLSLHNQYLKAALNKSIRTSSQNAAQAMHKWFEMEIKDKNIHFAAETLGYMVKASLQSPPGARRERLIRRYMGMAPGEVGLQILGDGMMTAEDLNDITAVTKTYNLGVAESNNAAVVETEESQLTADESKSATISTTIPDVRSMEQRGLGLKTLKQTLSLLTEKAADFDATKLDIDAQRQRQIRLEEDAVTSAIDRWREENAQLAKMGLDTSLQTRSLGSRMWVWHGKLCTAISEELVKVDEAEAKTTRVGDDIERCIYGPFLRYLSVEKIAATTILMCMNTLSSVGIEKGMPLSTVIMAIATAVEDESISEKLLKDQGRVSWGKVAPTDRAGFLSRQSRNSGLTHGPLKKELANILKGPDFGEGLNNQNWDPQWSAGIRAKLGAYLLSALIDTAGIPVTREDPTTGELLTQVQPAFSHAYQYKLGKKTGIIRPNSILVAQVKREPVHSLLAKHLPMVVEPEPWTGFNKGGFILHPAKVLRIKTGDKDQRFYAEAAVDNGDMKVMFEGLDVLGKTPWKINQPVFDVMLEAWNSGDGIASFPPLEPVLNSPPEPEPSLDPSERRKWLRSVKKVENTRASYHSQRCFQNFQLEIARALRDETFYFPHNLDFRGRAYPIPPLFNHMGADHCRGILLFGVGKELGVDGLRWLKVHLANVFGYDKASLSEREAFAMKHLDDVLDSVANPLNGKRWWLTAEDPWQCLATCFELKNAMEAPDVTKFVSHLPIHQDGTCNGLQHYAALGGDEWGAKQVNLEPGDRPADVYSAVADLVRQSVEVDLTTGNILAEYLHGRITRKVVKQTVMTNVYGVTFVGARDQVKKQLIAADPNIPNTNEMNVGMLSSYIATKIFKALSTMFKGAHDIQYWLGECANRISTALTTEQLNYIRANLDRVESKLQRNSKSAKEQGFSLEEHLQFKSSVIWTNPVRMPVVQPYRTSKSRIVATNLQRISISEPHRSDPVSKRKQLQGFPPNFVHSLDATHMVLSAIECDRQGLSFAAVHDSFWTHASDIGAMNNVLRDAFINIHTDDVIGRLAAEFRARYAGCLRLAKIKPNTKFANAVSDWRRTTRKARGIAKKAEDILTVKKLKLREILDEHERQRLLVSSEPEEVQRGKQMVTPASIMEDLGDEALEAMETDDELDAVGLGNINATPSALDSEMAFVDEESTADSEPHSEEAEVVASKPAAGSKKTDSFEKHMAALPAKESQSSAVWAWLPLTFPKVPQKGTFDVSRLRTSQYFFS